MVNNKNLIEAFIELESLRDRAGLSTINFHYDKNKVWRSSWVLDISPKIHVLREGSMSFVDVIYNTVQQITAELDTKS